MIFCNDGWLYNPENEVNENPQDLFVYDIADGPGGKLFREDLKRYVLSRE